MLKIKDNVDLKELEKFGFNSNGELYEISEYGGDYDNTFLCIDIKTREIEIWVSDEIYGCAVGENLLSKLFDLIQAGLVEKVVE